MRDLDQDLGPDLGPDSDRGYRTARHRSQAGRDESYRSQARRSPRPSPSPSPSPSRGRKPKSKSSRSRSARDADVALRSTRAPYVRDRHTQTPTKPRRRDMERDLDRATDRDRDLGRELRREIERSLMRDRDWGEGEGEDVNHRDDEEWDRDIARDWGRDIDQDWGWDRDQDQEPDGPDRGPDRSLIRELAVHARSPLLGGIKTKYGLPIIHSHSPYASAKLRTRTRY